MSSLPEGARRMLFHAYVGMLSFIHACVGIFHTFERLAGCFSTLNPRLRLRWNSQKVHSMALFDAS